MANRILAAVAALASASTTVHAVPIMGDFSGTVWGVSTNNATVPGDIGVGATVAGSFQFANLGEPPHSTNDTLNERRYVSQGQGSFLEIVVGDLVWHSDWLRLTVRDDSPLLLDDLFSLGYDSSLSYGDPVLALTQAAFPGVPEGLPNSSFGISLFDSSGPTDLLSGTGIPTSADEIDISSITTMNGSIFGNIDGQTSFFHIKFHVDNVQFSDLPVFQEPSDPPQPNDPPLPHEPVPVTEPGSFSLTLLGGLIFAMGRHRRRRTLAAA